MTDPRDLILEAFLRGDHEAAWIAIQAEADNVLTVRTVLVDPKVVAFRLAGHVATTMPTSITMEPPGELTTTGES